MCLECSLHVQFIDIDDYPGGYTLTIFLSLLTFHMSLVIYLLFSISFC